MQVFYPTKGSFKDRLKLAAVACASVFDALVFLASIGFVSSEVRCWLLFDIFD